jgi:hypothetical protein
LRRNSKLKAEKTAKIDVALALHWRWGYRASDADCGFGGDCDPVALHLPSVDPKALPRQAAELLR